MNLKAVNIVGEIEWLVSAHTCAVSDAERHLGHIFECGGKWIAFNATQPNRQKNGPRQLGPFKSFEDARASLEVSLGIARTPTVKSAGG